MKLEDEYDGMSPEQRAAMESMDREIESHYERLEVIAKQFFKYEYERSFQIAMDRTNSTPRILEWYEIFQRHYPAQWSIIEDRLKEQNQNDN